MNNPLHTTENTFTPPVIAPPEFLQEEDDRLACETNQLYMKIEDAIDPYREIWNEAAIKVYQSYYQNVHKRLDIARERCNELNGRIEELAALNLGEEVTPEIRRIERNRRPYAIITHSIAAKFDNVDDYLTYIRPNLDKELRNNMLSLIERCAVQNLDENKLEVICNGYQKNSLTLSFIDENERGFQVKLFMAAGNVGNKKPYVFSKISELNLKKGQEVEKSINQAVELDKMHGEKSLKDRIIAGLGAVEIDCSDLYLDAHAAYYKLLHDKLPYVRQRYEELQQEHGMLVKHENPRAKSVKRVMDGFSPLIKAEAAKYPTLDKYMAHCRKEWNDYFEKMVTRLAEKVVKGGLDEYTTRLKEVHLKENVLSMVLKDEFGDEIDCRMVFPASQSIQYAPQTTVRVDTVRIAEHQELAVRQKPKLMSLKDNSEQVKKKYSLKDLPEGLVTKPKITEYNGKMFVCCHINGKRQTPAPLQPEEWKKYLASNSNDKTELAIAHFQREIGKAMNRLEDVTRDEKRGLGR